MAHPRQLIRKQAVAVLLGRTLAGASVFPSRVAPYLSNGWQNELPAIAVYTMDENGEIFNASPREYRRTVELVIEIIVTEDADLDDTLDTIAREVEQLLLVDDTLGGTCNNLTYARTRMVIKEEGDKQFGGCRVIFDAEYQDRHPDDFFNDSLHDFNQLQTDYSLSNAQADPADRARTNIEDLNP